MDIKKVNVEFFSCTNENRNHIEKEVFSFLLLHTRCRLYLWKKKCIQNINVTEKRSFNGTKRKKNQPENQNFNNCWQLFTEIRVSVCGFPKRMLRNKATDSKTLQIFFIKNFLRMIHAANSMLRLDNWMNVRPFHMNYKKEMHLNETSQQENTFSNLTDRRS